VLDSESETIESLRLFDRLATLDGYVPPYAM
jgi:hypothetical protein